MSKHKKPAPEQPQHAHHHDADELAAVKAFLETYSRPVLIAVIAVAAAVIAAHVWRSRDTTQRTEASRALAAAQSVVELEDIVNDYPGTPSAPLALLALGRLHYDQGDYTAARTTYDRFLDRYSRHALAVAAELGRLHAIEAGGAPDALTEAAVGYERFIAAHPDHYLTPQARFGLARVRAAQDDRDAARELYESFIADNPDSPWLPHAEARIELLDRRPPPAALPAPVPPLTDAPDAIPGPVMGITPVEPPRPELEPPLHPDLSELPVDDDAPDAVAGEDESEPPDAVPASTD